MRFQFRFWMSKFMKNKTVPAVTHIRKPNYVWELLDVLTSSFLHRMVILGNIRFVVNTPCVILH